MGAPAQFPLFSFEDDAPDLFFMPLAARRALDLVGRRLSLEGWRTLSVDERLAIARAGSDDEVDRLATLAVLERAQVAAAEMDPAPDPDPDHVPPELARDLGDRRPLSASAWRDLRAIERFALRHAHRRAAERGDPERLATAYDAIVAKDARPPAVGGSTSRLSHVGPSGDARMVDVSAKSATARRAVAQGLVRMKPETAALARDASGPKGEVVGTARLAGIMAAKRTPELIPLCHTIALTRVQIEVHIDVPVGEVRVEATAEAIDRTGVEMEALVAATVCCLTIYDMLKAVDREMVVERIALLEKTGGKRDYKRSR